EPIPSEGVYANHLWESFSWADYLRYLTPARVRRIDSNFHSWVRPLIADLPDDFGVRPIISQMIARGGDDDLVSHRRAMRRQERASRRQKRIRWVATKLETHSPPLYRMLRKRRRYLDKMVAAGAFLATKGTISSASAIASAHRRRMFQSVYRNHL